VLVLPDIFDASSVNSLRLCVGVIVSGELGIVFGGVEMFSGGAIRELGLFKVWDLGLWSPPGVNITLFRPPGLSSKGVLVSSPRAFLLLPWAMFFLARLCSACSIGIMVVVVVMVVGLHSDIID